MKTILELMKITGYDFGGGLTFQTVLWASVYLSQALSSFTVGHISYFFT